VGQSYSGPDYEGISFALVSDRPRFGVEYRAYRSTASEPKIRLQNDADTHYRNYIVFTSYCFRVFIIPAMTNSQVGLVIYHFSRFVLFVNFSNLYHTPHHRPGSSITPLPPAYHSQPFWPTFRQPSPSSPKIPLTHRVFSPFSNIYVFMLARSHHYFLLYYIKNTITIIIIVCLYCIHDLRFVKHQSKTSMSINT